MAGEEMSSETALRVAYLGPKGSFTHQAALQVFPKENLQPQIDFQGVFTALNADTADRGILPVENSTNGFVVQMLDLLAQERSVSIIGETLVAVQQTLLGHRRPSKDQNDYSHITTLYSHPQAWGQCVPFLTQHLRHAERIDTTSTSRAAELVAQDTSGTSAALCSVLAAELYGLDVLEPSIEERKGNTTRFLVLQRSSALQQSIDSTNADSRYKTLIMFTIPHAQPASLANALAVFGRHRINLTSLNSRPHGERKWTYIFFAEFWGRPGDGEGEVDAALDEVTGVVEGWRRIGSWVSRGENG